MSMNPIRYTEKVVKSFLFIGLLMTPIPRKLSIRIARIDKVSAASFRREAQKINSGLVHWQAA